MVLFVGERTELLYLGNHLTDYVVVNVICIPFFLVYYIILRSNRIESDYHSQTLQLEKVRSEQLETELKFLKSQYHPHFLFNALNTVYFQIDEKNLLPRRTLEMISDLLRYQLYGGNQMVSVQEEIDYMRTYINLQKMRMSERLQLQVELPSGLERIAIYPLLFLPLIENAFKYVGGAYKLDIRMTWEPDEISFSIRNSVPDIPIPIDPVKKGIGLENLRRRLALLYPGKYVLETFLVNNEFVARLILKINEAS
ncbi:MAG: histidine kinase [Culturomica sp.]|nr:histidine kinase [Culturomica sp.]